VTCSKPSCGKRHERTSHKVRCYGYISDAEREEIEVEEAAGEDVAEERLLKFVVKLGAREKIEISMYEINLYVEELLEWIRATDKYFNYE
jgi:hypothetical protein